MRQVVAGALVAVGIAFAIGLVFAVPAGLGAIAGAVVFIVTLAFAFRGLEEGVFDGEVETDEEVESLGARIAKAEADAATQAENARRVAETVRAELTALKLKLGLQNTPRG